MRLEALSLDHVLNTHIMGVKRLENVYGPAKIEKSIFFSSVEQNLKKDMIQILGFPELLFSLD